MKKILILLSLTMLQACAFTATKVDHDFTYDANTSVITTNKNLELRKVTDKRSVESPEYITGKQNGWGMETSGSYNATKPIDSILNDLLNSALSKVESSDGDKTYYLEANLKEVDSDFVSGFLTVGYSIEAEVQYLLFDEQNNLIWENDYTGEAKRKGEGAITKGDVAESFNIALNESIKELLSDPIFLKNLE